MPTNQLLESKLFWRYNFAWLLWLIFISYLSNKHPGDLPVIGFLQFKGADKVVHAIFYFVLVLLMLWGFERQNWSRILSQKKFEIGFLSAFSWGGFIELLQKYIFTYRSAEWADQLANCIGAIIALLFFSVFSVRYFKFMNQLKNRATLVLAFFLLVTILSSCKSKCNCPTFSKTQIKPSISQNRA